MTSSMGKEPNKKGDRQFYSHSEEGFIKGSCKKGIQQILMYQSKTENSTTKPEPGRERVTIVRLKFCGFYAALSPKSILKSDSYAKIVGVFGFFLVFLLHSQ